MAAAKKKKAPAVPPLFKRWETDDGALVLRLDVEKPGHDLVLTIEDVTDDSEETDGRVELAADIPQIDELLALLGKAKDAAQRYNRGEDIESDIEEEDDEEITFVAGEGDPDEEEEDDLDDEDSEDEEDEEDEDE